MINTHFIKKIAEALEKHYEETNAGVTYYNNALSDLMRDRDHSEEWKGKERERLVRERIAYTDSRKMISKAKSRPFWMQNGRQSKAMPLAVFRAGINSQHCPC